MLRTLKFLTFGFLIVGFVGLAIGDVPNRCIRKGGGTEQEWREWVAANKGRIAASKTPLTMDVIHQAWLDDRVDLVLNEHNLPNGAPSIKPADIKGYCSWIDQPKGSSSTNRKGSASPGQSKGSSSSGHSKAKSSSGHSKAKSSSGHSKAKSSSGRSKAKASSGHSKARASSGHSKGSRSGSCCA